MIHINALQVTTRYRCWSGTSGRTGTIFAHDAHVKGCRDGYPGHYIRSDIEILGGILEATLVRRDQAYAVLDLQRQVGRARVSHAELVKTQGDVGESKSNVVAVGRRRRVFGQARVLNVAIESRIWRYTFLCSHDFRC